MSQPPYIIPYLLLIFFIFSLFIYLHFSNKIFYVHIIQSIYALLIRIGLYREDCRSCRAGAAGGRRGAFRAGRDSLPTAAECTAARPAVAKLSRSFRPRASLLRIGLRRRQALSL